MSDKKVYVKLTILDRLDQVVRVYNKTEHEAYCAEQNKTLEEVARGFCNKYPTRGYRIAEIDGGGQHTVIEDDDLGDEEGVEPPVSTGKEPVIDDEEDVEVTEEDLEKMSLTDLRQLAKNIGIEGGEKMKTKGLIAAIIKAQGEKEE